MCIRIHTHTHKLPTHTQEGAVLICSCRQLQELTAHPPAASGCRGLLSSSAAVTPWMPASTAAIAAAAAAATSILGPLRFSVRRAIKACRIQVMWVTDKAGNSLNKSHWEYKLAQITGILSLCFQGLSLLCNTLNTPEQGSCCCSCGFNGYCCCDCKLSEVRMDVLSQWHACV